jgi:hypothetical protein
LIGKVVLLFYDFLHLKRERTEPPPTPMAIPMMKLGTLLGKLLLRLRWQWTDPLSNKYSINKDV